MYSVQVFALRDINALISCLKISVSVWSHSFVVVLTLIQTDANPRLTEELSVPLKMMQDSARRIARVTIEAKLPLEEESYVEKFRPNIMDVVHAWCSVSSIEKWED